MSLFSPADPKAQQQAAYLGALAQTQAAGEAQKSVTGYGDQAIGALGTGYGSQRDALTNAFAPSLTAIQGGYAGANNAITSNYGTGLDQITKGIAGYDPYTSAGTTAQDMELKALGLGGPAGYSSAMSAFTASPQYQWNLDQATANAARGANRYGMLSSGNTMDAITRLGSNLASGEFNNWLKNLDTVSGRGLQAVAGQGGLYSTSGQLSSSFGRDIANLATGQGRDVAGLNTSLGTALGNSFASQGTGTGTVLSNEGSQVAGIQTGLGSALASAFNKAGDAQQQADAANTQFKTGLIGAGIGLAGKALAPMTGGLSSGIGSLGSSLGIGGGAGLQGLFGGFGGGTLTGGLGGSTLDPVYGRASSYY